MSDNKRRVITLIFLELFIILSFLFTAQIIWEALCPGPLQQCLLKQDSPLSSFLILSTIRPFLLTPFLTLPIMAGSKFTFFWSIFFSLIGALLSCFILFVLTKFLGHRIIYPWLKNNLPKTLNFIKSQEIKIIILFRLLPIIPFDFCTIFFGLLDFRLKNVLIFTVLGSLPEIILLSYFSQKNISLSQLYLVQIAPIIFFFFSIWLFFEFKSRKKGSSLWSKTKQMLQEIKDEIRWNNEIIFHQSHDPKKTPILIIYGFFSSHTCVTGLERNLTRRGYEVISFNLGGLFGVFFTRGIIESALLIHKKLILYMEKYSCKRIHIVGHSKGGVIALWWLLKLGGHKYCKTLITLGTPFNGSKRVWLPLLTPLGLLFRDLWQMRPHSKILKSLHEERIPSDLNIYTLYSRRDNWSGSTYGKHPLENKIENIHPLPMHHLTHTDFLNRRDVGDVISSILGPLAEKQERK